MSKGKSRIEALQTELNNLDDELGNLKKNGSWTDRWAKDMVEEVGMKTRVGLEAKREALKWALDILESEDYDRKKLEELV